MADGRLQLPRRDAVQGRVFYDLAGGAVGGDPGARARVREHVAALIPVTRFPSGGGDPGWYDIADIPLSDGGNSTAGEKTLVYWTTPADGLYYLRLRVRDGATEKVSSPRAVRVDNTAPPTPVIKLELKTPAGDLKPLKCGKVKKGDGLIRITVEAHDDNFSALSVAAEGNSSLSVPVVAVPEGSAGPAVPLSKTYNGNVADTGYPVPTSFLWDPWSDPGSSRAVTSSGSTSGIAPCSTTPGPAGTEARAGRRSSSASRAHHVGNRSRTRCGRRTQRRSHGHNKEKRGSEKVMAAWKARVLTEASIKEIAASFEKSPATIEGATFFGGEHSTGLSLSLSYDGDDGPWCGNDILFWLKWHLGHGGNPRPPRIIINGTPFPDLVRMELDFGHVGEQAPGLQDLAGEIGAIGIHG